MSRVFAPARVLSCIGERAQAVSNRSLRFDKFPLMSDSRDEKEWRKLFLDELVKIPPDANGLRARILDLPGAVSFEAALGGDLVVNHAVGVVENSGLALDRHFGHPYIPGSAVKGIARVGAALEGAALREQQVVLGWSPHNGDQYLPDEAPKAFAGTVAFFAAQPVRDAVLKVDIVNCHHMRYYQSGGAEPAWDNESPNPQFFLVVKAGAVFRFVLFPAGLHRVAAMKRLLGLAPDFNPLVAAQKWLRRGLTEHGIGAKTSAGYGWFTSEPAKPPTAEAAARAEIALSGDFTEKIFKSLLALADDKGQWANLRREIEKLKKPENAAWLAKFKQATAGPDYKELRKQEWYPK